MDDHDPAAEFRERVERSGIVAAYGDEALLAGVRERWGDAAERVLGRHFDNAAALAAFEEALSSLDPDARRRVLAGAIADADCAIADLEDRQSELRARLHQLEDENPDDLPPAA